VFSFSPGDAHQLVFVSRRRIQFGPLLISRGEARDYYKKKIFTIRHELANAHQPRPDAA